MILVIISDDNVTTAEETGVNGLQFTEPTTMSTYGHIAPTLAAPLVFGFLAWTSLSE